MQLAWERINEYNPEVIVVSCCGFAVKKAEIEISSNQVK